MTTLRDAISRSNVGYARSKDAKGREIVATLKTCGTKATGYYQDYRIVAGACDPTVVRRLRTAELRSTAWTPVQREKEFM